ncbi:MAG: HTH domain-containing protein [Lachnospiraceae bacterium]|nr:HTH domain-containing protein [Lachnospiraceae bacterium]
MNLFERRNAIMNMLCREGRVTAASIDRTFDVSERTIYSDITALSIEQPIQTVQGRYGGGVELADWFHPNANTLYPRQEELLEQLKPTLAGDDLIVLNSILVQFSPSH